MSYVSIPSELERIGAEWTQASDSEIRLLCPFHPDSSPSLYINTEKGVCNCKSCGWSGTFTGFLARKEDKSPAQVHYELLERYGQHELKTINPVRVDKAHTAIWSGGELLKQLFARGLTAEDVQAAKLGIERNKITIPIYDKDGFVINLRKYLPGAPGDKKFKDERGCGKDPALYPIEQLRYSNILLCGGEIKALSLVKHVNPHEIGAISATGGEGRWSVDLSEALNGKSRVWIAYDVDPKGKSAAKKIAQQIAAYVDWVGIIQLPLDEDKFPHGGVDDFVATGGEIMPLLQECERYKPTKVLERDYDSEDPTKFNALSKIVNADLIGDRIGVDCVVSSLGAMPYAVPKVVQCECQKNVDWCQICPMFSLKPEEMVKTIHPEDPSVLLMVDAPESALSENLKKACEIPNQCKVCKFEILDFQHAEDARISEHLDVTKRTDEKSMVPAIIMAEHMNMNEPYETIGRLYPSPKTSQSVYLISSASRKKDSLDSFTVSDGMELDKFQPREWTHKGLTDKLNEVYSDLEANVTRIYERRLMHLIVDLSYHSPLFIKFREKRVKGWVEVLIVGDSSQGKTDTAQFLQQHYGLGGWLSCKGASVAGVLGGLQQINKKWFVTWGAMPTQDRRLVVLEELKGLEPEALAKLTDARSSGIAELTKIEKRRAFCRVRLVALSNPRKGRTVGTYNTGVEAIQELIGNLEDIRRFDACYVARKEDLNLEDVIVKNLSVPHRYDSEMCRNLVLWAWTVKNTEYEDSDYLLHHSLEFGREYSDDVPIYDRGGGRYKIARLAAALACRTFSMKDPQTVLVRNCHVDFICELLHTIYRGEAMGYKDFSQRQEILSVISDPDKVLQYLNSLAHPREVCMRMLADNNFEMKDLKLLANLNEEEIGRFGSLLLRHHCVKKSARTYYKTPAFVKFLKDALANNDIIDRPDYIEEKQPDF